MPNEFLEHSCLSSRSVYFCSGCKDRYYGFLTEPQKACQDRAVPGVQTSRLPASLSKGNDFHGLGLLPVLRQVRENEYTAHLHLLAFR